MPITVLLISDRHTGCLISLVIMGSVAVVEVYLVEQNQGSSRLESAAPAGG